MAHELRGQRRRTKGWRKPAAAVCVTRPSKFANPYRIGDDHPETGKPMTRGDVVELFREYATLHLTDEDRELLRGKMLLCYCKPDQPCHADVLCEITNGDCDE